MTTHNDVTTSWRPDISLTSLSLSASDRLPGTDYFICWILCWVFLFFCSEGWFHHLWFLSTFPIYGYILNISELLEQEREMSGVRMNFPKPAFARSSVWVNLAQSDSVHCFWRTLPEGLGNFQEVPFHTCQLSPTCSIFHFPFPLRHYKMLCQDVTSSFDLHCIPI